MRPLRLVSVISAVVLGITMFAAQPLTAAPGAPAAFPAANGRIIDLNASEGFGMATMNPDGTGKRAVVYDPPMIVEAHWPRWSPQGTRIAFECVSYDPPSQGYDICTMKADGTNVKDVSNQYDFDVTPAWSPDSTQIVYANGYSTYDVWVMQADGSNKQDITSTPSSNDLLPVWSPDGSKIAFVTDRDGNWDVYTMNPDGTGLKNLTKNPANDGHASAPLSGGISWSPDGSRIAFSTDRDGNQEIYTMKADGSDVQRVTSDAAADANPVWSPDGMKFAFESDRSGLLAIYTMDVDGSNVAQLTKGNYWDRYPDWRPVTYKNAVVAVSDSGISPAQTTVKQGQTVRWDFAGTVSHAVNDTAGLGLFGSGSEPPGGAYAAWFFGAGKFAVLDPTTLATATVSVPATAKPSSGPSGTTFKVTWSSETPPPGFTFDVQMKTPGSTTWTTIESNTTDTSMTTSPSNPGTYQFRVRLRNGKAKSGWSPVAKFKVT